MARTQEQQDAISLKREATARAKHAAERVAFSRRCVEELVAMPIHPLAYRNPLTGKERDALIHDIAVNGLREPCTYVEDADGVKRLVDGLNRQEAMKAIVANGGYNFPVERTSYGVTEVLKGGGESTDPDEYVPGSLEAFIRSKNLHRRHLTKEEYAAWALATVEAAGATVTVTVAEAVKVLASAGLDVSKSTVEKTHAKRKGKTPAPRKPREVVSDAIPGVLLDITTDTRFNQVYRAFRQQVCDFLDAGFDRAVIKSALSKLQFDFLDGVKFERELEAAGLKEAPSSLATQSFPSY